MIGLPIIGLIGGVGCSITSSIAGIGLGTELRKVLYRKIQTLSFVEIDRFTTRSLVTRITNDITQIQQTSIMMMRILVRAPLQIAGSLVMAILISPQLSLVLVVILLILVAALILIIKRSYPLFTFKTEIVEHPTA